MLEIASEIEKILDKSPGDRSPCCATCSSTASLPISTQSSGGRSRRRKDFCSGLGSDPAAAAVADMILVGVGDFCERPVSADGEANVGGIAV